MKARLLIFVLLLALTSFLLGSLFGKVFFEIRVYASLQGLFSQYEKEIREQYGGPPDELLHQLEMSAADKTANKFGITKHEVAAIWLRRKSSELSIGQIEATLSRLSNAESNTAPSLTQPGKEIKIY